MKNIYSVIAAFLVSASVFAQAPQKMSYQAVIRNSSNALITSTPVGMRISVIQGSIVGTSVYVETQTSSTNANGLVSIEIGNGTPISGTFAGIDWANGPYFIKTETDPTGGTAYTIVGTNELMSVPYALFSANGTPGPQGPAGPAGSLDAWSRTGDAATVDGTNFIGTTDNIPFNIRVNNQKAGRIDVSSAGNTFFGYQSGNFNIGNNDNTGIGKQSLYSNTTGYQNTASGAYALYSNTTGNDNTAYGSNALEKNTEGYSNTASGHQALQNNTTGGGNTASGVRALSSNTTGNSNTASGMNALAINTTGNSNTASGLSALSSNTTGNFNTASGVYALEKNTTGNSNTASGVNALAFNTTGNFNTASGPYALSSNTTGNSNTASGLNALAINTTGNFNTASGSSSLSSNTIGNSNTALGYLSGSQIIYGSNNTTLGTLAGNQITYGSNNIAIGYDAQVPNTTGDNQIRIGDANIIYAGVQVAWSLTSDKRWKSDIQPSNLGLDFISKLKPVSYTRKNDESKKREYGFIAQDLEETLKASGVVDNGIISKDDAGMYSVRYNDLISPMVKAIQEQQELIKAMNEKMDAMQKEIDKLKSTK